MSDDTPKKSTKMEKMDPMRRLVLERLRNLEISFKSVSIAAGKSEGYISQWLNKNSPYFLSPEVAEVVCRELTISPEDWAKAVTDAERDRPVEADPPRPSNVVALLSGRHRESLPAALPETIPVVQFGSAEVVDRVPRPPRLAGVHGATAVWVDAPRGTRLQAGDMVYLRPAHAARIGDVVALRQASIVIAMGDLVSLNADSVVIREAEEPSTYQRRDVTIEKVVCIALP